VKNGFWRHVALATFRERRLSGPIKFRAISVTQIETKLPLAIAFRAELTEDFKTPCRGNTGINVKAHNRSNLGDNCSLRKPHSLWVLVRDISRFQES
jgi:hypothetical protein